MGGFITKQVVFPDYRIVPYCFVIIYLEQYSDQGFPSPAYHHGTI